MLIFIHSSLLISSWFSRFCTIILTVSRDNDWMAQSESVSRRFRSFAAASLAGIRVAWMKNSPSYLNLAHRSEKRGSVNHEETNSSSWHPKRRSSNQTFCSSFRIQSRFSDLKESQLSEETPCKGVTIQNIPLNGYIIQARCDSISGLRIYWFTGISDPHFLHTFWNFALTYLLICCSILVSYPPIDSSIVSNLPSTHTHRYFLRRCFLIFNSRAGAQREGKRRRARSHSLRRFFAEEVSSPPWDPYSRPVQLVIGKTRPELKPRNFLSSDSARARIGLHVSHLHIANLFPIMGSF